LWTINLKCLKQMEKTKLTISFCQVPICCYLLTWGD
jgi:hypothetical protein